MRDCTKVRAGLILFVVFYLSFSTGVNAGDVIVSWDPNTEADLLGYRVYWGTSSRNYTNFDDAKNDTSHRVTNLSEGVKYFFAVTAYDTAYNESDFSVEVSYEVPVKDIDPPVIASVNPVNATELELTYSEAVEQLSAENLSNYQIDNGITINSITLGSNKRVVHIKTTLHQPGIYAITVKNVADIAGNLIALNSSKSYQYDPGDTTPPTITNVQILDATHVDVSFSEAIDVSSAQMVTNFKINNNISIFQANLDQNQRTVHLVTSVHQTGTTFTLTVDNVRDRSPNHNPIKSNTTFQYELEVTSGSIVSGLSKDNYELAYLNVGDEYYVDRTYIISSIPEQMHGYLWIKTANDDRDKKDENFFSFQLSEAAKIYVAYDSRALGYPNWLVNDFYRSGKQVGVSEYADKLDLWVKECKPGVITLGANLAECGQGVESMYVVLIESQNSQHPGAPENMGDPLSLGPANMFLLYQNYPNPFNAGTEIRFQLPKNANVELTIYNIQGQAVRTLTQGYKTAGHHIMKWDGRNENGLSAPTGVYLSRLIIKKIEDVDGKNIYRTVYHHVRKMIMVR